MAVRALISEKFAAPHPLRRDTRINTVRFGVMCQHATDRDDRVPPKGYTWADNAARAYPDAILDDDWCCNQREANTFIVVVSIKQIRSLGNAYVPSDRDRNQIVNPYALPNPRMFSNGKAPRMFDPHARFYDYSPADVRTEQPQHPSFRPIKWEKCARE